MTRIGHDSRGAALIYQRSSRAFDEAIAAALDERLTARPEAVETASRVTAGARVGPEDDKGDQTAAG